MPSLSERLARLVRLILGADPFPALRPAHEESGFVAASAAGSRGPEPRRPTPPRPAAVRTPDPRFLLSVDDAGEFLVVASARATIGHLSAGRADLGFLADVGALHAELERTLSLREGPRWRIAPVGGERVRIGGVELGPEGAQLAEGERVELGPNLAFRFRLPDPASHTATLDLERGAECGGARSILLLGEGEGGRLRIGAGVERHVRVPTLAHEITIVREGEDLFVRCAAGVRAARSEHEGRFRLPCPPPQRVDLWIGRSEGGRPPFGLAIAPLPPRTAPRGATGRGER
jgi:hypothetical protein